MGKIMGAVNQISTLNCWGDTVRKLSLKKRVERNKEGKRPLLMWKIVHCEKQSCRNLFCESGSSEEGSCVENCLSAISACLRENQSFRKSTVIKKILFYV